MNCTGLMHVTVGPDIETKRSEQFVVHASGFVCSIGSGLFSCVAYE